MCIRDRRLLQRLGALGGQLRDLGGEGIALLLELLRLRCEGRDQFVVLGQGLSLILI